MICPCICKEQALLNSIANKNTKDNFWNVLSSFILADMLSTDIANIVGRGHIIHTRDKPYPGQWLTHNLAYQRLSSCAPRTYYIMHTGDKLSCGLMQTCRLRMVMALLWKTNLVVVQELFTWTVQQHILETHCSVKVDMLKKYKSQTISWQRGHPGHGITWCITYQRSTGTPQTINFPFVRTGKKKWFKQPNIGYMPNKAYWKQALKRPVHSGDKHYQMKLLSCYTCVLERSFIL